VTSVGQCPRQRTSDVGETPDLGERDRLSDREQDPRPPRRLPYGAPWFTVIELHSLRDPASFNLSRDTGFGGTHDVLLAGRGKIPFALS
jgi:hypothetical protein